MNLKYHTTDSSRPIEYLNTAIKHITKDDKGRFKGYHVVGVSILGEQDSERERTIDVVCASCKTRYKLPYTRIPQRRTVTACRKCRGKIVIEPGATKVANYSPQAEPVSRVP